VSEPVHDNYGPKGPGSAILRAANKHATTLAFVKAVEAAAAEARIDECKVQAGNFAFERVEGEPDVEACIRIELGIGIRAMVAYLPAARVEQLKRPEMLGKAMVLDMKMSLDAALPWEQAWLKEGE
jgi:hypothetical protein